jgi:hypothetical protein
LGRFPLQWLTHPGEHLRFWTATDCRWWIKSLGAHMENFTLHQGLPVLNKIWPGLFSQGIIFMISFNKNND